jgi:biopolymer transport protein ExbD
MGVPIFTLGEGKMEFQIKRRRGRIEIVPMIDIMFFMLVFFMLFSTLDKAKTGIEVELPKTVNIGAAKTNTVVISINKDGQFFFGQNQVNLDQLQTEIRREIVKDPRTRFIIRPDATVPYGDIIRVTDLLASEGIYKPLWGVDRQQMPKSAAASP